MIKIFSDLDNQGGSNLTDRSTGPVADPLQVGKDFFWDLKVNTFGKVLGIKSERVYRI
jgi:hypothetical protein